MNTGLSKMQQRHTFMNEAKERFPDLLALDVATAWTTLHAEQPMLYGLQKLWTESQTEQAALRALQAAAPLPIALETVAERTQLASQLLNHEHDISDTSLIGWTRKMARSPHMRLFRQQVETLYPQINIQGYRAIAAEAARLGWPKLFREDMIIDLKTLCTPGMPKQFWWGLRSTGTDLFKPHDLRAVEWALARKHHGPDEQRHYAYNGKTLRSITLDALIIQLVHTLDMKYYEQMQQEKWHAEDQAKEARFQSFEAMQVYREACQKTKQAENDYRKVKHLKQQYQ